MDTFTTILIAVLSSSGVWGVLQIIITKKMSKKTELTATEEAIRKMLLGLAHDRIYSLCSGFIERGSITLKEYDNFQYLAQPYIELGGNGTGHKLIDQVEELPIKDREEN